jgi:N-methylhydantoinase A
VRTYRRRTRQLDLAELNETWRRMEAEALAQLAGEGFTGAATRLKRLVDLGYHGQSFELTVPVAPGALDPSSIARLEEDFGREHERTYGHRAGPEEPVELVTLRLVAQGIPERSRVPDRLQEPLALAGRGRGGGSAAATRQVYFGPERGRLATPILRRGDLATPRIGPCIVEEYDATCLIPPDAHARLDDYGNIVIEVTP